MSSLRRNDKNSKKVVEHFTSVTSIFFIIMSIVFIVGGFMAYKEYRKIKRQG